jgi:hypothetical protein
MRVGREGRPRLGEGDGDCRPAAWKRRFSSPEVAALAPSLAVDHECEQPFDQGPGAFEVVALGGVDNVRSAASVDPRGRPERMSRGPPAAQRALSGQGSQSLRESRRPARRAHWVTCVSGCRSLCCGPPGLQGEAPEPADRRLAGSGRGRHLENTRQMPSASSSALRGSSRAAASTSSSLPISSARLKRT